MHTDKKTFVNRKNWSHYGTYTVELVGGTTTKIVPKDPDNVINKNIVTINNGSLGQSIGGISMRDSRNNAFHWGYNHIKCIRDGKGGLLWVNDNYRNEK